MPTPVVFMDLQMHKIGCVSFACFPKSGHIWLQVYLSIATLGTRAHKHYNLATYSYVLYIAIDAQSIYFINGT